MSIVNYHHLTISTYIIVLFIGIGIANHNSQDFEKIYILHKLKGKSCVSEFYHSLNLINISSCKDPLCNM